MTTEEHRSSSLLAGGLVLCLRCKVHLTLAVSPLANELGVGRNVLVGDEVLHCFDGLCTTLHCMPAAHGSGKSVVQGLTGAVSL